MINVILADNSRPPVSGPFLVRYTATGVYLALVKNGFDARYIDQISKSEGDVSPALDQNSADVCCYGVFFGNKVNAFRQMEEVRRSKTAPRIIIAFGSFASVFSEEILLRGLADIVVDSDPEFVIPAILQKGDHADLLVDIPNLSYLHEGKIIHTRKHSFPDLDEIPFVSPYLYSQGLRPAHIVTARGCQYHCVYCDRNTHWGGGVRNRSVENVLNEIEDLVSKNQVSEIRFLDEDLAADRERLMKLCVGIRRIKGRFKWECSACVDSVSKELLLLMRHSRCGKVNFGVESASPDVLRRIGKRYGREDILNAVRWTKEAGVGVEIMLTIGNPGETDFDRDLTVSMLRDIGRDVAVTTNQLVIAPGTALYRKGLREGWFTQKSFFEDKGLIFYDEQGLASEN